MKQELKLGTDWKSELKDGFGKFKRFTVSAKLVSPYLMSRTFHAMFPKEKDYVVVSCYGSTELWINRNEAKRFYLRGAEESDGNESETYLDIVCDIECGLRFANYYQ